LLERGARVFALDVDSPEQHAAMVAKLHLPFPMLSDPDRSAVIEPWGLANPSDRRDLAYPAIVVVTPEGDVAFRWESHEYAFRIPEDEVVAAVELLGLEPTVQGPPEPGPEQPGPNAMPLRALFPYLRGARFAAIAFGNRYPEISDDVALFTEQVDRYSAAIRNLRERTRRDAAGSDEPPRP
jgi:hypothetical protein